MADAVAIEAENIVHDPEQLEALLKEIPTSAYKIPSPDSRIFKDECTYCFNTPFSQGGLYICLKTFTCYCEKHVRFVAERTANRAYLQTLSRKVVVDEPEEPRDKIKRLAIGVDDGFCNDKVDVDDEHFLVVYPDLSTRIPLPILRDLPIGAACQRIAETTSAERLELLQGASNAWDGEAKVVTKHANLTQVDNPRKLSPTGWTCDVEGCGLKENLWLNLTDGAIRCGRSQFIAEGTRSKGNNHARMYYDETKFPLVVKLGTIEKSGVADIFSYDEDNSVIDPNLDKHIAHFGLRLEDMEKTEKSTIELELDINQKWEWAKCQEDGENLENIYGPGYTGMINIGSSCYINSVVQSLLQVPDLVNRFGTAADGIFSTISAADMHDSFNGQTAKLFSSLMSGDYSKPNSDGNGIKPTQFRRLVGRGHPEFSTARQQDAEEYIRHLLDKVTTNNPPGAADPTAALRFKMETRLVDNASGRVRYSERDEVVLSLPIPKQELVPVDQEAVRFSVTLQACLSAAFSSETIEGFKSPVTGEVKGATSSNRMASFPDFLVVQIQKFQMEPDFNVKKMDVDILVDPDLDLEGVRGKGPQEGEVLLEDGGEEEAAAIPAANPDAVAHLEAMGFSHNSSLRAVVETKNNGVEAAAEWLMSRLDDPTIHAPLTAPPKRNISPEAVQQLVAFGFTTHQAKYALSKEPEVNAAAEWLFSNVESVPPEETVQQPKQASTLQMRDGRGTYRLCAFISHMGSSPHSGHYVAHILREGKWVLFNDEKVALSKNPPLQLAYLYLFRRI